MIDNDTRTTLEKAQDFAIGQVLSEWDSNFTYDDIIRVLRSDAYAEGDEEAVESVTPWYPYENNLSGSSTANVIEGMVSDLMFLFGGEE
jgi:hypothetical protein